MLRIPGRSRESARRSDQPCALPATDRGPSPPDRRVLESRNVRHKDLISCSVNGCTRRDVAPCHLTKRGPQVMVKATTKRTLSSSRACSGSRNTCSCRNLSIERVCLAHDHAIGPDSHRGHGRRVVLQPDSHRPLHSRQLASARGVPGVGTVSSHAPPACDGLKCYLPLCRSPYDPGPRDVVPAPPPFRLALPRARAPDRVDPGAGVRPLHRG